MSANSSVGPVIAPAGGAAGESGARRRRAERPATVPLSEFGKEAPPPPRARLSTQQIVIGLAVTALALALITVFLIWAGGIADNKWSQTRCLDARVQC